MPRRSGFSITPHLRVSRCELAGAFLATAAEAEFAVCGSPRVDAGPRGWTAQLELAFAALDHAPTDAPLGISLVREKCTFWIVQQPQRRFVLRADYDNGDGRAAPATTAALGAVLHRQLIFRRIVTTLRRRGFLLLERMTHANASITLRAHMPAIHHLRRSARTAPPDFVVEIDPAGEVSATMQQLSRYHRPAVEDTLRNALVQQDSAHTPRQPAGIDRPRRRIPHACRPRRVDAA